MLITAENGGKECTGNAAESKSCNNGGCSNNCVWGEFGKWTTCSKSCGSGVKSRTRSKLKEAENGGSECRGDSKETESCNTQGCPVDCKWNNFGEWSSCTKSCGTGIKSRTRSKLKEAKNGGTPCVGDSKETESCNSHGCPIDCKWSSFGEWSSCSKTCGDGYQSRQRSKLISAENGGRDCEGSSNDKQSCNLRNCPIDCEWGEYSDWSMCTKSCGGGEKSRTRKKLIQAENGGAACEGDSTEVTPCNIDSCPIDLGEGTR